MSEPRILAVIPARGGSVGVEGKNLRRLMGRPLIAWTIEAAHASRRLARTILSSDDEAIIETARDLGCEVPFRRPPELAQADTPGIMPILHALESLQEVYEYVVCLQPTSPLRRAEHIDAAIATFFSNEADTCVGVVSVEQHPYWMMRELPDGCLAPFVEDAPTVTRRQDLPPVYALNGAFYMARSESLARSGSFVHGRCVPFVMDRRSSLDIDTELDFLIAEALLGRAE